MNKIILSLTILTITSLGFLSTPQKVEALEFVKIVSDISEPAVTTALKTTLLDINQAIATAEITSMNLKEMVLDPISWGMGKELQQQLTSDILKWLGGQLEGQNGQIPMVQDFSEHYGNVLNSVAGQFIFGDELSGRCSEEEDFQVKQAVYEWHLSVNSSAPNVFQCQDENNEQYNTLEKIMRDTVSCDGDSICATLKGQKKLAERQANAIANETQILNISKGMLPQRVCRTVNNSDGQSVTDCKITNPLYLAAESTVFNLVDLPGLSLLNMDEFDEVVSNLMSNLTNQALTGLTGVLGLSGNSSYGSSVFGPDGDLSYADALAQDDISRYQTGGVNPIAESLDSERRYFELQSGILEVIQELEDKLDQNANEFPQCFDMELTSDLQTTKEQSTINLQVSSTTIAILNTLNDQYRNATTSNDRNSAVTTYISYQSQGLFRTDYQNQELVLTFIDLTFADWVDKFKYDTAIRRQECGGDFDYDGVLTATSTPTS